MGDIISFEDKKAQTPDAHDKTACTPIETLEGLLEMLRDGHFGAIENMCVVLTTEKSLHLIELDREQRKNTLFMLGQTVLGLLTDQI